MRDWYSGLGTSISNSEVNLPQESGICCCVLSVSELVCVYLGEYSGILCDEMPLGSDLIN